MTIKARHPEKINKPINPIKKKPSWIKSKLTNSKEFFFTKNVLYRGSLLIFAESFLTAIDTAKMALAPIFVFCLVPSRFIKIVSIRSWS